MVDVQFFRSDVSRDSLIVSESQKECEHRPPFLSLSLIKTVSSCVVQIVCVITNQGSSNPNCLNSVNHIKSTSFVLCVISLFD